MTRKTMAFVALLALALLVSQGSALAALVRCKGGKCEGTEQADDMRGTLGADQTFSLGGDDQIVLKSGNDRANGGEGKDLIFGESGIDRLDGGSGPDRITGGDDADIIFGGTGSDVLDSASDEGLSPVQDEVVCDSGVDTVRADRLDKVAADCENVTRV